MGNLEDVGREIHRPPSSWRDVLDGTRLKGWTPMMVCKEAHRLMYDWFVHNDQVYRVIRRGRDDADFWKMPWTADDVTRESYRR
jgi:hypothetical protein